MMWVHELVRTWKFSHLLSHRVIHNCATTTRLNHDEYSLRMYRLFRHTAYQIKLRGVGDRNLGKISEA